MRQYLRIGITGLPCVSFRFAQSTASSSRHTNHDDIMIAALSPVILACATGSSPVMTAVKVTGA
jgi:hypothetical protein